MMDKLIVLVNLEDKGVIDTISPEDHDVNGCSKYDKDAYIREVEHVQSSKKRILSLKIGCRVSKHTKECHCNY